LLSHVVWQTVALDIDGRGVGCGWCAKTKRGTSSRTSISLWCKQSNVWYQWERREGWALGRALAATSSRPCRTLSGISAYASLDSVYLGTFSIKAYRFLSPSIGSS